MNNNRAPTMSGKNWLFNSIAKIILDNVTFSLQPSEFKLITGLLAVEKVRY